MGGPGGGEQRGAVKGGGGGIEVGAGGEGLCTRWPHLRHKALC